MYGLHVMGYVGIALLVSALSSPTIFGEDVGSNFIGRSSEDITQAILRGNEKNITNYIFSPFGYSVILGILSEGARGETREELTKILHLPEDVGAVRENYRSTLQRLQERSASNVPEFRNYFYVYKNFTVEDDYKATLLQDYFTEVKSVDRPNYEDFEDEAPSEAPATLATEFSTTKIVPVPQQTAASEQKLDVSTVTLTPVTESLPPTKDETPNKSTLTKRSGRSERIKRSNHERLKRLARRFLGINLEPSPRSEVSSISANRLNSGDVTRSLSRMVVFNGLYFKGYWKIPFQYKQGEEPFYKSSTEKVMTRMVYAVGQFYMGQIADLDSTVLSVPYKGERYSFVVVLPNEKDGIHNVIANLQKLDLGNMRAQLKLRHLQVSLPAFEFRSTSYLKEPLKTIGIQKIFTNEADFSGLSRDSGLFVDDIVQLVTIKVDNEAGTPNFLTASSVQTRTVTEKFTADRPFVFFVQDHKDNLIIAAGKLYEPTRE